MMDLPALPESQLCSTPFDITHVSSNISGVGLDFVEVSRFENVKDERELLQQILTDQEMDDVPRGKSREVYVASVFAMKESIMKALGCGLSYGSYWHDIEITKQSSVTLSGFIQKLAKEKSISKIHVSHSHSRRHIVALVLLER